MKSTQSSNINNTLLKSSGFHNILIHKKIDPSIFQSGEIRFDEDISEHAEWVYTNIYKARNRNSIIRAARLAIFVLVFVNLYRRHEDSEASALTDDDVKIIQIAALFIDSAREDSGIDHSEKESGLLLYHYLTDVLCIPSAKAITAAEILANKNILSDSENKLSNKSDEMKWISTNQKYFISIQQKLLYDAIHLDSLTQCKTSNEYNNFNKSKFNFNTLNLKTTGDNELSWLIADAFKFIESQGGGPYDSPQTRQGYETYNAYSKLVNLLKGNTFHYKIIPQLFNNSKLLITLISWKMEIAKNSNLTNEIQDELTSSNTTILKINSPFSFWETNKYRMLVTVVFTIAVILSAILFPYALFGIVPLAAFCIILAGNKPTRLQPFTFKTDNSPTNETKTEYVSEIESETKPFNITPAIRSRTVDMNAEKEEDNSTVKSSPISTNIKSYDTNLPQNSTLDLKRITPPQMNSASASPTTRLSIRLGFMNNKNDEHSPSMRPANANNMQKSIFLRNLERKNAETNSPHSNSPHSNENKLSTLFFSPPRSAPPLNQQKQYTNSSQLNA